MFVPSQLHVSRPLTDLVLAYQPAEDGFIRSEMFPRKPVNHLTDLIRQVDKSNITRLIDTETGPGAPSTEVQFRMDSNLSYLARAYSAEAFLDSMESRDADAEVNYEQRQTKHALMAVMHHLEYKAIVENLRSTSVLTQNTTILAASRWDNFTSPDSNPIEDLKLAVRRVEMETGRKVNRIAMSKPVWDALASNPNSILRVTFDPARTGAIITPRIVEEILDVEPGSIKISRAVYNAAAWGQTGVFKSFLSNDVVVARVEQPGIDEYGLGHEFAFSGFTSDPMVVLRYPQQNRGPLGSEAVKVTTIVDFKVLNPKAGYLLKTAVNTTFDSTLA